MSVTCNDKQSYEAGKSGIIKNNKIILIQLSDGTTHLLIIPLSSSDLTSKCRTVPIFLDLPVRSMTRRIYRHIYDISSCDILHAEKVP
jgi:hypothetical protein